MDVETCLNFDGNPEIQKLYANRYSFFKSKPKPFLTTTDNPLRVFYSGETEALVKAARTKVEHPGKGFTRGFRTLEVEKVHDREAKKYLEENFMKIDKGVPIEIMEEAQQFPLEKLEFTSFKKIKKWEKHITKVELQSEQPIEVLRKKAAKSLEPNLTRLTEVELQAGESTGNTLTEMRTYKKKTQLSKLDFQVSKNSLKLPFLESRGSSVSAKRTKSWTIKNDSKKGISYQRAKSRPKYIEKPSDPQTSLKENSDKYGIDISEDLRGESSRGFFKKLETSSGGGSRKNKRIKEKPALPRPEILDKVRDLLSFEADKQTSLVREKILEDIENDLIMLGSVGKLRDIVKIGEIRKITIGEHPLNVDMSKPSVNHQMVNIQGESHELESIIQRMARQMANLGQDLKDLEFGERFLQERATMNQRIIQIQSDSYSSSLNDPYELESNNLNESESKLSPNSKILK